MTFSCLQSRAPKGTEVVAGALASRAIIPSTGSAPGIRQCSGPCPLPLGTFKTLASQLQSGLLAHQCGDIMLPQVGLKPCQMKKMATHSSILTGKFHGQRRLVVYSPWGGKMKNGHSLKTKQNFPDDPVVKGTSASAAHTGLIPGPGTKVPRAVGQLSLSATTTEPMHSRAHAHWSLHMLQRRFRVLQLRRRCPSHGSPEKWEPSCPFYR